MQILRTLTGISAGWNQHPAVRQWAGYEGALCLYGIAMCDEWVTRGYVDNMRPVFEAHLLFLDNTNAPPWIGLERYHSSHRAALLAKDFAWYKQFGWRETPCIDYFWPSKNDNK